MKNLIRINSTQSPILISVLDQMNLLHSRTPKLCTVSFSFLHHFYGSLLWVFLFIYLDIHNFSDILLMFWQCWFSKKYRKIKFNSTSMRPCRYQNNKLFWPMMWYLYWSLFFILLLLLLYLDCKTNQRSIPLEYLLQLLVQLIIKKTFISCYTMSCRSFRWFIFRCVQDIFTNTLVMDILSFWWI